MSDTPRTQELREDLAGIASEAQIWKLFKKLEDMERELTAVTEQRDELLRYNEEFRKETLICADCDAISKEEYDRAIEQRDGLRSGIDYASDQLHKVNEQLKEAKEIYQKSYSAELARSSHYKQQRDRLAEALQKLADCDWVISLPDRMDAVRTIAREALAAVKGGKP